MGIIYKVTNKINGKIYIGQTKNELIKRRRMHENEAKYSKLSKSVFHRALKKYGFENFIWEIVEYCSECMLNSREIYYIQEFKSNIYLYPENGYNMTIGGDGYMNHFNPNKDEIYQRISLANSGKNHYLYRKMTIDERETHLDKHWRGENNPMYGRKKSAEEIEILRKRMFENNPFKGKKHTDETKLKMSINGKGKITGEKNPNYGKKGEFSHVSKKYIITLKSGYEFFVHGIDEFCDWYKETFNIILQPQNISTTAKGKHKHHKGLLVRFYNIECDVDVKYWKDVLEEIKKENENA